MHHVFIYINRIHQNRLAIKTCKTLVNVLYCASCRLQPNKFSEVNDVHKKTNQYSLLPILPHNTKSSYALLPVHSTTLYMHGVQLSRRYAVKRSVEKPEARSSSDEELEKGRKFYNTIL